MAEAGAGVLLLGVDLPVIGGEVVALHQNGTGGGDAHVPADVPHIGADLRGFFAQRNRFIKIWHAEVYEWRSGIGVHVEIHAGFIGHSGAADDTIVADERVEPAACGVIYKCAVTARAHKAVQHMHVAFVIC